jgi:nitroreductase
MQIDVLSVDEVLTTTRAVRLRLDLERPVDLQIVYDCIDIAEQAPTGGNQGSRRWIVVRDPDVRRRLAELYRQVAGRFMIEGRDRLAGSGHPQERVMRSAAHLAEHLEQVPVIVIPTIIGHHDGQGRPGLFDSVIQSAWSFCLALRARGLGTCWTTAILSADAELKELLDIPEEMSEIVMLPVAWTVGTDFRRALRHDARAITYVDTFARTFESGPSDPVRMADGPGTVAEADIAARPSDVWTKVVDVGFAARFSDELVSASWDDPDRAPGVGSTFVGRNTHRAVGEWDMRCFVDVFEEHRRFGWCTADPDDPGARWRFELEPIAGATRLRFVVALGPGPSGTTAAIAHQPDKEARIIHRRIGELHANMDRVVTGIKSAVETG